MYVRKRIARFGIFSNFLQFGYVHMVKLVLIHVARIRIFVYSTWETT